MNNFDENLHDISPYKKALFFNKKNMTTEVIECPIRSCFMDNLSPCFCKGVERGSSDLLLTLPTKRLHSFFLQAEIYILS